jgi:hypothetical protein
VTGDATTTPGTCHLPSPVTLIKDVQATSDGVQVTYTLAGVTRVVLVPPEGLPLTGDTRRDEVRCSVLEAAGRCIIPG